MESASEQTFVGLDVHRKSVTVTAFDAVRSRVSQERFGATDAELLAESYARVSLNEIRGILGSLVD